ncbi:hypothetical protein CDCA_CDCA06G1889 [Cyanidium caldarium]|uniref:Glutathione S-transferase 3, mitochondrial n=1 Tax=Cyanidium caldarium TaxID=2771 RepID=A0AAV9IUP7_CYACA|nr:hypothetical protein CDCA_CDCA06G1889 [Cyanidium caldarium]
MGLTSALPQHYGLVMLDVVAALVLHATFSMRVGQARRKYKVSYPNMFEVNPPQGTSVFNCTQRGHQHYMETCTFYLPLLLLSGLEYPVAAAALGAVYLVGRWLHFTGYATGDPNKRHSGDVYLFGVLGNLVLCVLTALKHL